MRYHQYIQYAVLPFLFNLSDAVPEPGRMVTKDELARHDGNQTKEMWLSILSQVYDVTAGDQYYSPGSSYSVFVGRDANVPFVTGKFDQEECDKSLLNLTSHQVFSLSHWAEFYEKEEKYPFVGYLVGDLYDETGKPTEMMGKVEEMIAEAKLVVEEKKKKTAEIIARRKIEDAEKKKRLEEEQLKETSAGQSEKAEL